VAFSSRSTNLTPEPNGCYENVFVRDLRAHTTELATPVDASPEIADEGFVNCENPSISGDGRFVAFTTRYGPYSRSLPQVFVRDLATDTTTLVSVAEPGAEAVRGYAGSPSISANGRWIAFLSGSNLTTDDPDRAADIFIRDTLNETTSLATPNSHPGTDGSTPIIRPSISPDGSAVAFVGTPFNAPRVFLADLTAGSIEAVRSGFIGTDAVSRGGDRVAFTSRRSRAGRRYYAVQVRDRVSGRTIPVTAGVAGLDDDLVYGAELSADGERLVFVVNPEGEKPQAYLSDLEPGKALPIRGATGGVLSPALSGNGRWLAFRSDAPHLHPDDTPGTGGADIFATKLPKR
jgi:Tol biopolymer transport system component